MKSHSNENDQDKESKITFEKPVSLSSLSLREALEGLIGKKPKEDKEQKEKQESYIKNH